MVLIMKENGKMIYLMVKVFKNIVMDGNIKVFIVYI